MRRTAPLIALLGAALSLSACYDDDTTPGVAAGGSAGVEPGVGTSQAVVERCLACHSEIGAAWAHPSSHGVLFDCNGCHDLGLRLPHEEPVVLPSCERCHSEMVHPEKGSACSTCHDPHGSSNLFLIRTTLRLPSGQTASVKLTELSGAAPGGLVRAGVDGETAGTGLCEVCHTATNHYDSTGTASAHQTGWCGDCHDHQTGFSPSKMAP